MNQIYKSEEEVTKLMNSTVNSGDTTETKQLKLKMRKKISESLRRKGNYNHNIKVLQQGHGELVVKRCPTKEINYREFLPCEFFLDFLYRKDLY